MHNQNQFPKQQEFPEQLDGCYTWQLLGEKIYNIWKTGITLLS